MNESMGWDGRVFFVVFWWKDPWKMYIYIHSPSSPYPIILSLHFLFFCFFFVVSAGIGIIIDFIHSCTDTRFLSSTTL